MENPSTIATVGTKVNLEPPKMYKVIFHNDDRTSFEFVIECLQVIFHKCFEEASEITYAIHEKGSGIAGIYDMETAEVKTAETLLVANQYGYPLLVTYEAE